MVDLDRIEAQARAALAYERSTFDEGERMYVQPATSDEAEPMCCPLCDGEGEVDGARYDATEEQYAATVVAYGIGEGLGLAEQWVENAPRDMLALVAELRAARAAVERLTAERDAAIAERDVANCRYIDERNRANRLEHELERLRTAAADERADVVAMFRARSARWHKSGSSIGEITSRLYGEAAIEVEQGAHVGAAKGGER